jgi:uncharacterized membrane protein
LRQTRSAILLPIVVTFYVTYHFLELFDGLFSVMGRQEVHVRA